MTRFPLLLTQSLVALPLSFAPLARGAEPASLDYQAPAGCADVGSFVAAVEARGGSFTLPAAVEPEPRRLVVRIAAADTGFAGSLTVQSGGEASEPRHVLGATCAEVSDALAVVTAIALQRDAEAAPGAVAATPPLAGLAPAPAAVLPPAPVAAGSPPEVVMSRKELDVPPGKLVLDYLATYTLDVGVQLGAIPGVVFSRLDFSVSRTNTVTTPDARAFVLGNEFRVRWTVLGPAHHRSGSYDTELFGIKAGIAGCTPLTYDPGGLMLKACSEIAAGVMGLKTRDSSSGFERVTSQGLATVDLEADLQYNLSGLLHLNVRAGGEFWTRISAEREDGSQLFQSPLFNAHLTVGVGVHF